MRVIESALAFAFKFDELRPLARTTNETAQAPKWGPVTHCARVGQNSPNWVLG